MWWFYDKPLKVYDYGLELVPNCQPNTYQAIGQWLIVLFSKAGQMAYLNYLSLDDKICHLKRERQECLEIILVWW